ncbi:Bax inhibitor-1 family protein [Hydrogenophaga pseudoflava]|jgi:modulator of FtsH protease|uniref:Modulator of FtsH protease YccA n=1 Tax=Hydrogenophaga pseudoflava TaxID=47421 RepID=A0A4P6WWM4_HYDPS|nr:Bax inhibitor-1 family protein [Hydrogenophaga pseudoflava]QBM27977.1 Modulator of FtsH protease YccA [Hydrogenophaga pseudoflava]
MTDFTQYQGTAGALSAERNKVLRNTYWLLALCLLPTVLGAWIGVSTGITRNLGGIVGMVLFIGGMMAFQFAIYRFRNSGAGVAILMAFTFFMGLMLSRLLGVVLGMGNGTTLVMAAFASTAGVFFTMATLATVIKRDLSGMGRWLFAGMIAILIAAVVNIFIGSSAMMLALTALSTLVFSLYMLYDVKNIVDGGETNYIVAATQLFIDIFAVFQNLLALFGIMGGDD